MRTNQYKQKKGCIFLLIFIGLFPFSSLGQLDEDQLGAWYMYFWNTTIKEGPWGFQGDVQHRNWDLAGDLEQLLLRGGLTYAPAVSTVKFTLGYGYVRTGEFGSGKGIVEESRIYQEALLPQRVAERFYVTHRFRYEQRQVESQDLRSRFRYNLFLNVPINRKDLEPGAIYLAFYNELFINGERSIGDDRTVEVFDRNRSYGAVGYSVVKGLRIQAGLMQQTTDVWKKRQLQLSLHHKF